MKRKDFLKYYKDKIKDCKSIPEAVKRLENDDLIFSSHVIKLKFNCLDQDILKETNDCYQNHVIDFYCK